MNFSANIEADNELIILMPVYNDWEALARLLPLLDGELRSSGFHAAVLLVDDGSNSTVPTKLSAVTYTYIQSIDVLPLRRNLGHQRAIAVGLSYIEAHRPCRFVVIMDCDGEDDPHDVPRLVRECITTNNIVFAARSKRSEGLAFTVFYHLYRLVHFLLTGVQVRVGNFSVVPISSLRCLVAVSELWNHYAAAVHKAKLPMQLIKSERGTRLAGPSRMDLVALVVHGLSAMAVFGDRIGVRLMILVSTGIIFTTAALLSVVGIRLFTTLAIPGWATYATGLLFVMLIQMLLVLLIFVFVILASRERANMIPSRDYIHISGDIIRIYG